MQIFIKTVSGVTRTFDVESSTSIFELKLLYLPCAVRLVFAGEQLDDERTIESYNIQKGRTLYCALRQFP
jgi:hypothetical protein